MVFEFPKCLQPLFIDTIVGVGDIGQAVGEDVVFFPQQFVAVVVNLLYTIVLRILYPVVRHGDGHSLLHYVFDVSFVVQHSISHLVEIQIMVGQHLFVTFVHVVFVCVVYIRVIACVLVTSVSQYLTFFMIFWELRDSI